VTALSPIQQPRAIPFAGEEPILLPGMPQPVQPGQPGVQTTAIDPAQDLRSQQITAGADPRLSTTQGQVDQSAQRVADARYVAPNTANDPYVLQAGNLLGQATAAGQPQAIPYTNTGAAQSYLQQAGQAGQPQALPYTNTGAAQSYLQQAAQLAGGQGGGDRMGLAQQAFGLLNEDIDRSRTQGVRDIGRGAAAFGRTGAGMTTNELTGLESELDRNRNRAARELSLQAASGAIDDSFRNAGLGQSAAGIFRGLASDQLGFDRLGRQEREGDRAFDLQRGNFLSDLSGRQLGLDRVGRQEREGDRAFDLQRGDFLSGLAGQAFGMGRGLRDESRTDQGIAFDRDRAALGDFAGLERQQFGQGAAHRDELRGERGFQAGMAQQGIDNAMRQRMMEEDLLNSGFRRSMSEADLYGDLAFGGDANLMNTLGGQAGTERASADQAFGGIGDMLGEFLMNRASNKVGPAPQLPSFPGVPANLPRERVNV
jgi:hypothetical protein